MFFFSKNLKRTEDSKDTGKGPVLGMGKRGYTKGVLFLLEGKGLYLWAEPSRIKIFSLPPRVSNKETLLRAKFLELLVKWVTNNFAQKELYF